MRTNTLHASGAATYWTSSAVVRGGLDEGLKRLGLPPVTEETPAATLRRALAEKWAGRETLVRAAGDGGEGRVAVVREVRVKGEPNAYDTLLEASVGDDGTIRVVGGDSGAHHAVVAEYEARRRETPVLLVSRCLVACVRALRGVPLKDTGGIYWLPPAATETWERAARLFEGAAVRRGALSVYAMRTPLDAQTVRAVTAAINSEIAARVEEISAELATGLGARAADARRAELEGLGAKLRDYERILQADLGATSARLADAQTALAAAALVGAGGAA